MLQHQLVLLPGMDGTGDLFAPFLAALPQHFCATVVKYPRDRKLHYQHLIPYIREVIPWNQPYTLVAESFGGPLALQFAAAQPENVQAIVLSASFVSNPVHPALKWARFLATDSLFSKKPPASFVRKFLTGDDASDFLVDHVAETIHSVKPDVLAFRAGLVMDLDARQALVKCEKPILCLAGAQDNLVGDRGLAEILALKPSVQTAVFNGPHLLLQSRPREAFTEIQKFLGSLAA